MNPIPRRDLDEEYEFLPLPECAERMGVTVRQLRKLMKSGAVAYRYDGFGLLARPTLLV